MFLVGKGEDKNICLEVAELHSHRFEIVKNQYSDKWIGRAGLGAERKRLVERMFISRNGNVSVSGPW